MENDNNSKLADEVNELTPVQLDQIAISRKTAVEILWNRGSLNYLLDELQQNMKMRYYNSKRKVNVWLASRRLGKSRLLCVLALEQCIKHPGSIIKYLTPEMSQTKRIINPLIRELINDAPDNLKPEFKTQEMLWRFPNGSEIHIGGSDAGGAEKLRGAFAHLCIVDEAGFCDGLKYAVRSIMLPTLLTTGGKLVLSSTPPKDTGHDFVDFIEEADANGTLIRKTIYDCPRYTEEFIQREIISQYSHGKDNPEFRREYMCVITKDDDISVIPEFNDILKKEIVKEWQKPTHYDAYVSVDYGVRDFTVVLFGYYDFKSAKLIVEDELVLNGARMNTKILADQIRAKELKLWSDPYTGEAIPPYLRVSDNNLLLIQDMSMSHGLTFIPTEKHNKEGFLNSLRLMFVDHKIIINPRCRTLISHLEYATWDKNRKSYARSAVYGHYDAIDALLYMSRNIVFSHNPFPRNSHSFDTFVPPTVEKPLSQQAQTIKSMFIRPKRFNKY